MIKFDVQVKIGDLRNYMYSHKYGRITGKLELILGLICLVSGIVLAKSGSEKWHAYVLFLVIFGVFFLVISPIQTFVNSAKQYLANPMISKPLTYVLSDEGIELSQGDIVNNMPWSGVYAIRANKNNIFIYFSRFSANIIPKRCIEKELDDVIGCFKANVDSKRCKL